MSQERIGWFHILVGVVLGLVALLAAEPLLQVMGALALLVTAGLLLSRRRGTEGDAAPAVPGPTPELSWTERILPWVFLAVAIVVVLALTLYTLNQVGGGP